LGEDEPDRVFTGREQGAREELEIEFGETRPLPGTPIQQRP
jgi:hypothetical protein